MKLQFEDMLFNDKRHSEIFHEFTDNDILHLYMFDDYEITYKIKWMTAKPKIRMSFIFYFICKFPTPAIHKARVSQNFRNFQLA